LTIEGRSFAESEEASMQQKQVVDTFRSRDRLRIAVSRSIYAISGKSKKKVPYPFGTDMPGVARDQQISFARMLIFLPRTHPNIVQQPHKPHPFPYHPSSNSAICPNHARLLGQYTLQP
jgi:hypothetical protein